MSEDWVGRWQEGRTGWYEEGGNAGLKNYWPAMPEDSRVLVPLCGNSPDLEWLVRHGCAVTGVEISDIAVTEFFARRQLEFDVSSTGKMQRYSAPDCSLEIVCGDYFDFEEQQFDALYDRGALVALSPDIRAGYVEHTKSLLKDDAVRMVIALEYDQSIVAGPPFSVMPNEVLDYWPDMKRMQVKNDLENCPPKFRKAGLKKIDEVVWLAKTEKT